MLSRLPLLFLALGSLVLAATRPAGPDARFSAKELAQGYADDTIIAKPRASHRARIDSDEAREGVRVHARFERIGDMRVIAVATGETVDAAIARLTATGRYEFVVRDRIRHLDATTPNDPSFTDQWGLNNTGASGGVAGADIKATAAWDIIREAPNVVVAILDTGINLNHQDLAPNLWRNPAPTRSDVNGANFVGGRGATFTGNPADDNGHGTHVAGIVGAAGNNGLASAGVAWKVQLMAVKVFPATGSGRNSEITAGINYAIRHGAHLINGSYGETGSGGFDQDEFAAISAARDAGILFVAAAGNDAANMDVSRHYPASHALDNIVTVGSSQRNDFVSASSNYGAAVDLFAPGESIVSLNYASTTGVTPKSGTSMAAPHVAGALALLKAQFPTDTHRQLINRLLRGTDPGTRFAGKAQAGGRLNLFKALTSPSNAPFNDTFAERARLVGDNFLVRSNNTGAATDPGEPAHAGLPGGASLWWEWTPTTTAAVRVTTTGSAYDTLLALYTGTAVGTLTPVASNDNDGAATTSRIDFTAQAGVTYHIAVDGKNGASGLTLLNLGSVPANDAFATPVTITGASDLVLATNANCTREAGEPRILTFAGGTSLWYRWTAPRSARFQFGVTSTDFDPILAVYTGDTLGSLVLVTANDNLPAPSTTTTTTAAVCTVEAIAGTTYRLSVDAKSAVGSFALTLNDSTWQAAATDVITGAPAVAADGTVYVGSTDGSLYAFNPDGSRKTGFPVATANSIDTASPAIADDGTIYVGSNDGLLYAFNPDGTQKWTRSFNTTTGSATTLNPAANSPALGPDGTIYLKVADGSLHAINPTDGSVKWKTSVNSPLATFYGSPAVGPDGTIYQGSDENDKRLFAINPDGTVKWTFAVDSGVYTAPALDAAGNIYFCTLTGGVYSVTPTGTQRWRAVSGGNISSSPALSADGSTLYYGGYDRKLYARATATGAVRWAFELGNEVRASSPAVDANGVIYLGCYDQKIYAVNPDGTLKRTWATGNFIRSAPAIAGTMLYCGSNDEKLYAIDLGVGSAGGPWPQYRANARRLGRAVSETFALSLALAPKSQTVVLGLPLNLSIVASGTGLTTYQWSKDGAPITGATSASYGVAAATFATAGTYSVSVTNAGTTLTSPPAVITVEPLKPGRLVNLSVRTTAGTGTQALIVGFNLSGSAAKPLLIRGIGPALTAFGVSDALADPRITLLNADSNATVDANDNWSGAPAIAAAAASVGAFPLDATSRDAALARSLPAGSYTVQITGTASAGAGITLAEIYDADPTPADAQTFVAVSRLANVSARAQVGTGTGVLIAGFALNGNVPKRILLRGVGPSLAQFGVTGPLANPLLQVFDAKQSLVTSNDDWAGSADLTAAFAAVSAFPLSGSNSRDAALIATLAPGSYTAQISGLPAGAGVNNTTGIALVEVYELP